MSKGKYLALKLYPKIGLCGNLMKRKEFVEGYQQAMEEMIKWLIKNAHFYCTNDIYVDAMINDLKQAMKDE